MAELDGIGDFSKLNQQDKLAELIIIELNQQAKLAQHGRRLGWAR
jgi:hypothetical protein